MPHTDLTPVSPRHSVAQMTEFCFPNDTNPLGNMMGGRLMHLIDVAAAIAARRHCGRIPVTASMDSLDFLHPIPLGAIVVLEARVTWTGRTSMEVKVDVYVEVNRDERVRTCSAYLTFVALDEFGRPTPVPPLLLETDEDRELFEAGAVRRQARLARR